MKEVFLVLFFCGLAISTGWALEGTELLKNIDAQVVFETDYTAKYTITQNKPGEGVNVQTIALFRRDKENKFTIIILDPPVDQGKGYLKVGNNLWYYDPSDRRFVVSSAKDRFQNSNARNSDFTKSTLATDYKVVATSQEKLGKFDTQVLDLEAIHDGVTFPLRRIWVTAENLLRKSEDRSLSGQLLRTTAMPQYMKVGPRWVPVKMIIVDNLHGKIIDGVFRGETTTLEVHQPNLDIVPDLVFTQGYLQKVSR